MAVTRGLVIHFMDGSSVKLEIPKQVKSDESIVPRLEKILERQVLMAEVDGALMLVPFSWVSNMGYEKETETGYEKAVKVAGFPGLEKWNTDSKNGELTLVANKRYIIELEGNDIGDPKVLHQLAESMALSKLPAQ